jgi:hypothetical protein
MKKKNEEFEFTEGSKYKIYSISSKEKLMETLGTFKGYVNIGEETGFLIEIRENRKKTMRIIPLQMIVAIDIITTKDKKNDKTTKENTYYFN